MKTGLKEWLRNIGFARRIERHNFLIYRITREYAQTLPYRGRVVDLGCGKAPYKDIILDKAEEYIGVDWQNSMHDQSAVDVFADLSKRLPFDDAYADTVVSFEVLEHLPEPDFFLSECNRVLKTTGVLFLTVPFMWHVHEEPYDYFRYTRYGLQYLLEKNGFSEVIIEEKTGFWQMWWLKFNYHTHCFARGPVKYLWYPIWWLTQTLAPLMDKLNSSSGQTALYGVRAKKDDRISAPRNKECANTSPT